MDVMGSVSGMPSPPTPPQLYQVRLTCPPIFFNLFFLKMQSQLGSSPSKGCEHSHRGDLTIHLLTRLPLQDFPEPEQLSYEQRLLCMPL